MKRRLRGCRSAAKRPKTNQKEQEHGSGPYNRWMTQRHRQKSLHGRDVANGQVTASSWPANSSPGGLPYHRQSGSNRSRRHCPAAKCPNSRQPSHQPRTLPGCGSRHSAHHDSPRLQSVARRRRPHRPGDCVAERIVCGFSLAFGAIRNGCNSLMDEWDSLAV